MSATRRRIATVALIVLVAAIAAPTASADQAVTSAATTKLGKRLTTEFWTLLKTKDHAGLRRFLSPAFQVQRADGTGATKQEYIPTIGKTVIIDDFTLSAFHVTRSGDTLVVRFVAVTKQIIDDQLYSKDPAPRIVTYQRTDGRWQMTSNANFNAPAAS